MLELLLTAGLSLAVIPPTPCDPVCERQAASDRIERGETRAAVEGLKQALQRYPDDRRLVLLLARAYLVEGNLFWAERTLTQAVERWPDDTELRLWLATVHLRQADTDLMEQDLDPRLEPADGPQQSRWRLIEAFRLTLDPGQQGAENDPAGVASIETLFPEDQPVWLSLRSKEDPWWLQSITGSADLAIGHTSNALAGSPTDPGASGGPSPLGLLELRTRFAPPSGGAVRPAFDLELLGNGIAAEQYNDLSSFQGGVRLGALVAKDRRRFAFGYRFERLDLNQQPSLYSEAHRAEGELEWLGGSVLFAGAGRRTYQDDRRSRWEADVGYGGALRLTRRAPLIAGATLRLADAESQAYDQIGLSGVASASFPLGRGAALRLAFSAVWDDYPHSGGEEGLEVFGTEEKRRDLLGRIGVVVSAPTRGGLRPSLELRYTQRDSTADEAPGFDFSFSEWRVLAWIRWTFATDPWGPRTVTEDEHVPLDWGLEQRGGIEEERILDLLRRDEELRRGSSCGVTP